MLNSNAKLNYIVTFRALELKNECERRMIDRMRSGTSKPANVSFISDLNKTNSSLYSTDLEQSSFLF